MKRLTGLIDWWFSLSDKTLFALALMLVVGSFTGAAIGDLRVVALYTTVSAALAVLVGGAIGAFFVYKENRQDANGGQA